MVSGIMRVVIKDFQKLTVYFSGSSNPISTVEPSEFFAWKRPRLYDITHIGEVV